MCSQRRHRLHSAACQNPLRGSRVESPDIQDLDDGEVGDDHEVGDNDDDHDKEDDHDDHSGLHVRWKIG